MCDSERKLDLALVQSVVQKAMSSDPPNDRKHCKLGDIASSKDSILNFWAFELTDPVTTSL